MSALFGLAACARSASETAPSASPSAASVPAAGSQAPAAVSHVPDAASHAPAATTATHASLSPGGASSPAPGTSEPGPIAAPTATPVVAPTVPAGPQILSLSVTPSVVHAGGSVAFAARTTPDIANVTAFVSAYTLPFTRTAAGRFSLAFAIPASVPGVFHGTYTMNVVARSANGASASRTIAVTFQ